MVTLDNPLEHRRDGIANAVDNLSRCMTGKGHDVLVAGLCKSVKKEKRIVENGVTYVCWPDRGSGLVARATMLMLEGRGSIERLCEEEKIDIAHGHGGFVGPIAAATIRSKKVLTVHSSSLEDVLAMKDLKESGMVYPYLKRAILPPRAAVRQYRRWYFDEMDTIISVSRHNVTEDSAYLRINPSRFKVIPNGVDYEGLSELRRQCDESVDGPIVFVGRLAPIKGLPCLLRAFHSVLKKCPETRLKIVGEGPSERLLKTLAKDLRMADKVDFTGFKSGLDLVREIVGSGVFVVPSTYEGCPLSLLEAMALGRPIVASRIPGVTEIMDEGKTGLAFEPGNPDSLSTRILELLDDEARSRSLGQAAEAVARERFTWDRVADRTLEEYASTLA